MTETRWLTDSEQQAWRAFIAVTGKLQALLDRQLTVSAGMPHTYYLVLAMLSEAPDRSLRMAQLADLLNASPSRTSHAVARLEENGWVRRQRHSTDKRGNVAVLTDEGWQVLVAAAPGHVETVYRAVFSHLTPQQVADLGEISGIVLTGIHEVLAEIEDHEP